MKTYILFNKGTKIEEDMEYSFDTQAEIDAFHRGLLEGCSVDDFEIMTSAMMIDYRATWLIDEVIKHLQIGKETDISNADVKSMCTNAIGDLELTKEIIRKHSERSIRTQKQE